ncbi:MAG: chlorite dismutase family protein [Candidatus Methylomirabilales bacterium]
MAERETRQFVKYTFFQVLPEWRRLPGEEREESKKAFIEAVEAFTPQMLIRSYSVVGMRGDVDFLLWTVSEKLEILQQFTTRILSTVLGGYLTIPHSYLAMTKRSIYVSQHVHEGQEGTRLTVKPAGAKYLFVYPFVKSRAWYRMTQGARQGMMDEHIRVGHRYPSVKINTAYSFGLDDQEFVVAFETDEPGDFLDLVIELRETEASLYTLRDTPIFTCLAIGLRETLDTLGG